MNLYNCYKKLYELTKKQNEYIAENDYDQLLKILSQKKKIIEEVDKLDPEDYIKEQKNSKQALAKLQKLMTEIKELEEENEKDIKENKENLKMKMKDLTLKQKGRAGYKKAKKYEAKFIDKES